MRQDIVRAVTSATALVLLVMVTQGAAQESSAPAVASKEKFNPLQRGWYTEQGVELPRMFGIGVNFIFMQRDIAVTDVKVTIGDRSPESISDRIDFDVRNRTMLSMVRFDAWVLPFLDVYLMAGQTRTDTSLMTAFVIHPPVGDPVPINVETNQKVNGPLLGAGGTLVFGGDAWFAMVDGNYSQSDLDTFNEKIDAWFLSGRIGWHQTIPGRQIRAWGGVAYLDSKRTLSLTTEFPILGTAVVEVDQEPVNPVTYEVGASLSFNRKWDVMVEIGSNLDDAFLTVVSGSYRF